MEVKESSGIDISALTASLENQTGAGELATQLEAEAAKVADDQAAILELSKNTTSDNLVYSASDFISNPDTSEAKEEDSAGADYISFTYQGHDSFGVVQSGTSLSAASEVDQEEGAETTKDSQVAVEPEDEFAGAGADYIQHTYSTYNSSGDFSVGTLKAGEKFQIAEPEADEQGANPPASSEEDSEQ